MTGKGSKQRPTDRKKFSDGWDRVFKPKDSPSQTPSDHEPEAHQESESDQSES